MTRTLPGSKVDVLPIPGTGCGPIHGDSKVGVESQKPERAPPQGCVRDPAGLRIFFWQLEQFKKDNEETGFGSGTRALEQALEKTKANIKWVKENKEVVLQWFTENSK